MSDDDISFIADSLAAEILDHVDCDPERPVSVKTIARRLTGFEPESADIRSEGVIATVSGKDRIYYSRRLLPDRRGWILGHEILHAWVRMHGLRVDHEELVADAVGARLVAPAAAFRRAIGLHGCRVHELATRFRTTQALALLRVGEVTGRAVMVDRPYRRIARGEHFVWPQDLRLVPREVAHPIRIDGRWGMMAAA